MKLDLTKLEELVLLAVYRLAKNAYGVTILDFLRAELGKDLAVATVYAQLDRLARKGLVLAYQGPPTRTRGGRRKRMFEISKNGLEALVEAQRTYEKLWSGLQLEGLTTGVG